FYFVSASLACRVPGLPEHTVDLAKGEVVAFVLRRVTVAASGAETGEWAWVKRADGTEGWAPASGPVLAADEELLPMFATTFAGTGGLRSAPMQRRVFAGLVPASKRETYANARELAAATPVPAPGSLDDPRVIDFQRAVLDPWIEMKEWYDGQKTDDIRRVQALDSAEASSAFLLLDFYDYLRAELPRVADVVDGTRQLSTLPAAQQVLHAALNGVGVTTRAAGNRATLVQALSHAAAHRAALENLAGTTARVPGGGYVARVLVGDPRDPNPAPVPGQPGADETALRALLLTREAAPLELNDPPNAVFGPRRLKKLVMDALAAEGPADAVVPEKLPARAPANVQGDDWFTVRCVYLRPNCGRKSPAVVSDRSERFRLVSFFEPDAPARHLRVALPVDTSPATLRKYNRNVAFMLSDQLRKQMSRATDMKKLLDGEAGAEDGGITFGVICSLSIPIITICAFIILMILVSLLNIIFWWIPLFKICFPVPKLKG
ncbi:MAG TPA: hypothetical protein VM759_11895, partial [Longimicrobium sp.]|nr:hypothetical protein [Longimicrobium sp.]